MDEHKLPIGKYMETEFVNFFWKKPFISKFSVNHFMVDRIHTTLRENMKIRDLKTVNAKVPIVCFKIDIKDVDPSEESEIFEFDVCF